MTVSRTPAETIDAPRVVMAFRASVEADAAMWRSTGAADR